MDTPEQFPVPAAEQGVQVAVPVKRGRGRPPGAKNKPKTTSLTGGDKTQVNLAPRDVSFMSNPRIKKVGVQIAFTAEQEAEFERCADDPIYFIENYVKFMTLDGGLRTVTLYPFQREQVTAYHEERKVIVKTPRQVGKTSVTVGYLLHYVLFNKDKTVGVLAQKEKVAVEILTRIKAAYEFIPLWMQQGIKNWNQTSLELENGCRILAESTSTGAIRGFTINLLYLDEFAHVQPHIATDFITSVYPTISSGTTSKIIITSTPFGLNLFYKFWMDAIKKDKDPKGWNKFTAIQTNWWDVPGRDQEWADEQLKILGEHKFAQDILAEFLGSSNTLINGKKLHALAYTTPVELLFNDTMSIYDKPVKGHSYAIAADPSEGKGLDYSALTVFDITAAPYKVVAKFRDNKVEDLMFASFIHQTAVHYNQAHVIAENNAVGAMVLNHLINDLDYDNCFWSGNDSMGEITATQMGGAKMRTPGVRTSEKVKTQGCLKLKTLIETDQIIVTDFDIISELSTFVLNKNKKFAAEAGYYDDTVSTMWLFAWLTAQPYFRDMSDLNLRERVFAQRERDIYDNLLPPPMVTETNFKPKPKLEVSEGVVWIDATMSYEQALDILNGKDDDVPVPIV